MSYRKINAASEKIINCRVTYPSNHCCQIRILAGERPGICTSNHMFGRAIRDKLPECIFENFEIASVTRAISKFSKITRVIYPKNRPNQACDYRLITLNQRTLCIETNIS